VAAGYDYQFFVGENISAGPGWDSFGFGVFELDPISAARDVMYGTTNIDALSNFDLTSVFGGDGFASWDEVGDGWSESNWDNWGESWMGSLLVGLHASAQPTNGFCDTLLREKRIKVSL